MDSSVSTNGQPPSVGLPPVQPPSGRFIAQLFVIPGLIIFVVVLLYIGTNLMVQHEREPAQFLAQLDSDNPDIRWRGAADLAQILKRPEPATLRWKADAKFALDLADRLDQAFQRIVKEEHAGPDKDKDLPWHRLGKDRDLVSFLASALGEFHAPVGAPVLCAILKHDKSPDEKGNKLQRRKALWALMNMGENARGFAKMPAEKQQSLLAALKEEAAGSGPRSDQARTALYYIDKTALSSGDTGVVKVDETLAFSATAEDRFLRQLTAMAFNFWDGDLAVPTLLKLSKDDGHGTLSDVGESP
jgi:hypothetical protein